MGIILSRWKQKPTTIEALESLEKDIQALEKRKKSNLDRQRSLIGSLLLYSAIIYISLACIFYFYFEANNLLDRLFLSSPFIVFPFLIWLLKKLLHWYFVKRISSTDEALEALLEKKKDILEDVMENETYKKAKDILEKFDPVRHKHLEESERETSPKENGTELRKRHKGAGGGSPNQSFIPSTPASKMLSTTLTTPAINPDVQPTPNLASHPNRKLFQVTPGGPMYGPPPGPPMARPILPRERSLAERVFDALLADGPEHRYALICSECYSHNGMAMKEEYEYLSFRCCYCYTFNKARKQRPRAPPISEVQLACQFQPKKSNNEICNPQGLPSGDDIEGSQEKNSTKEIIEEKKAK